ncbi:MAG: hypothetical protein HY282_09455 [Nitrospirae bacterium]|nr:hypothetical protein [Candidatus Manganitrophaceae bacterium]
MSGFLNRVLTAGLRRVGPTGRVASPAVQETLEKKPAPTEAAARPEGRDEDPPRRVETEREAPAGMNWLEEAVAPEPSGRSMPPAGPIALDPLAAGREKSMGAERVSFERVEFDPAVPYRALRRFQPSQRGEDGAASPKSNRSAQEVVWKVLPIEPLRSRSRIPPGESVDPPAALSQAQTPSFTDPPQPHAAQIKKDTGPATLFPKSPAESSSPSERKRPPSGIEAKSETGDLVIEQLDVRVIAEPERRPQVPRMRPATPKRAGAWETAARYYLKKV